MAAGLSGDRQLMEASERAAPRLHMVGNAHIDPVWIWDWREGMHEVLQTFRAALERLAAHDGLYFTASSAAQYQWVQEVDPELFARVKESVAGGRWIVTGGQWIEPDCNLPNGEAVCRQLLYGQRYFARQLGRPARIGYNIDSFGHCGSLPQLLARSGIDAYVMMRPADEEMAAPSPLFSWEGIDGTRLRTFRIPFDYSTRDGPEDELIRTRSNALAELADAAGLPMMVFFGIGDHGGGPTRLAIGAIDSEIAASPGDVCFSNPEKYFDAVGERELPVVRGELNRHAVGCYSSYAPVKRANARAEQSLVAAEALAEMCRLTTGRDITSGEEIASAWRDVLFAQFHDSLGGTCIEPAYQAIEDMQARALATADCIATLATHVITQQIDTWTDGAESAEGIESVIMGLPAPMVVFNPLSRPVRKIVGLPHPISVASDDSGRRTPVQQLVSGEVTYSPTRAAFQADVPALGWQLYWLRVFEPEDGSAGEPPQSSLETSAATIGNGIVRCGFDPTSGALSSLTTPCGGDEGDGGRLEWLAGRGLLPVVIADPSDTWGHGVSRYEGEEQAFELVDSQLTETGPVRATRRLVFGWGNSILVEEVSVYDGQPFAEVRLDVDWQDPFHVLKLVVPTALEVERARAGVAYGHLVRPADGTEQPMVHWVGAEGVVAGRAAALGCSVDFTYAYDLTANRLRLTVLRSPRFADHGMGWADANPTGYPVMGRGRHRCSFRLHPRLGERAGAGVALDAEVHRTDLPVVLDTWHPGHLARSQSLVDVSGTISVGALKRAEAAPGSVLRIWETAGERTTAGLGLPLYGRTWEAELGPHEVKTLFVPDDAAAPLREIDIPELELGG